MEGWIPECSVDMILLYRRESREFVYKIRQTESLTQGEKYSGQLSSAENRRGSLSSSVGVWNECGVYVTHLVMNSFCCRKVLLPPLFSPPRAMHCWYWTPVSARLGTLGQKPWEGGGTCLSWSAPQLSFYISLNIAIKLHIFQINFIAGGNIFV